MKILFALILFDCFLFFFVLFFYILSVPQTPLPLPPGTLKIEEETLKDSSGTFGRSLRDLMGELKIKIGLNKPTNRCSVFECVSVFMITYWFFLSFLFSGQNKLDNVTMTSLCNTLGQRGNVFRQN